MGYARHALLQFGGSLNKSSASAPGNEIWTSGIRVAYDNEGQFDHELDYDEEMDYLNDQAVPALTEWFTNPDTGIHQSASLDWVKFNAIDPAGHYLLDQTAVVDLTGVVGGRTSSARHPSQVSLAATFETGKTRGRAKLGRIYIPAPTQGMIADGTIAGPELDAVVLTTSGLIEDLSKSGGPFNTRRFVPVVASKLPPKSGGTVGEMNAITAVSIDGRFDVQRRRGNAIVAFRASRTIGG